MGVAADRWGRRPVLIVSLILFVAVGTLPALTGNLYALLLTRFPVGIAEAGILSVQGALLGDYFEGQEREKWLGRMSLISPIAGALLVLAGGFLGTVNWRTPFLLYLLGIPLLIWTLGWLFEPADRRPRSTSIEDRRQFPWSTAVRVGLVTLGFSVLYYVQALQLGRMFGEHGISSPARIGLFVTVASIGVVIGGWAYPRLSGISMYRRFALALGAFAIGLMGIGLAPTVASTMAAALIAQLGNGIIIPALIGWSLQQFGAQYRGVGMGTWAACFFAGTFLSPPLLTGVQAASGSFLSAIVWTGVVSGVAAIVVLAVRPAPSSSHQAHIRRGD
jgi:MFS family permease